MECLRQRLLLLHLSRRTPLRLLSARPPPGNMAAATALFMNRAATVVSLQQLIEESSPPKPSAEPRPDEAVSAVIGACLPRVTFARERSGKTDKKRIRSFGDLSTAMPDLDNDSSGCALHLIAARRPRL